MLVLFYVAIALVVMLFAAPVMRHIYEQPMSTTPVIIRGRIRDKTLVVDSVRDGKIRLGDQILGTQSALCFIVGFESGHGEFGTYLNDVWQFTPRDSSFLATRPMNLLV